jgi:hypothetical protein
LPTENDIIVKYLALMGGLNMFGSVGASVYDAGAAIADVAGSAIKSVANVVAEYPVLAIVGAAVAYELYADNTSSSNTPGHLGQNVDTKA